VAFAYDHACTTKEDAIVHTQDVGDMETLRVALFTTVCLERV
jgi:hypothetical protein